MQRWTDVARSLAVGSALAALLGCGGGGDGGAAPPPPDNTPATVTLSATGAATLTSGNTLTLTASALTRAGRPVTGVSVSWSSSNTQVATVDNGLITGVLVGTTQVTASVGGVTSAPLAVTVVPGAASRLALRTQPAGAAVAAPLGTQPVVELRDAAGNVVTSGSAAVTAALASGGGAMAGTATVSTTNGVAAFTDLSITGTVGARTLSFAAPGLNPVTSSPFNLAPGAPASLVITRQPVGGAVSAPLLTQPVVELRDVSGNLATNASTTVSAGLSGFTGTIGGTVSVAAAAGVVTFTNLVVNGQPGTYTLTFSSTGIPGVAARSMVLPAIIFGLTNQKVQLLDVGASVAPSVSSGTLPTFTARAPSRLSVDNTGRVTGTAEGQGFLVASNALGADSVLGVVTRAPGGPVVRTTLPTYVLAPGDTTTIDLLLDPRNTPVGAFTVIVNLNTQDFSPVYSLQSINAPGVQSAAAQTNPNVFRFSVISASPITTPVVFGRLRLVSGPGGSRLVLSMTTADIFGPTGQDLLLQTTSIFYPLAFR